MMRVQLGGGSDTLEETVRLVWNQGRRRPANTTRQLNHLRGHNQMAIQ